MARGYPTPANLTPTLAEVTPVITSFSSMSGVEGDTVTAFGSELLGVMAVKVASIPTINIAVSSDNEINFIINTDNTLG